MIRHKNAVEIEMTACRIAGTVPELVLGDRKVVRVAHREQARGRQRLIRTHVRFDVVTIGGGGVA